MSLYFMLSLFTFSHFSHVFIYLENPRFSLYNFLYTR
jgi:hypothetical protein